jgi:predicted Zn-dependent protease
MSCTLALALAGSLQADEVSLRQARALLDHGRYAESIDLAEQHAAQDPVESALIRAAALAATGRATAARDLLAEMREQHSENVPLLHTQGLLAEQRGDAAAVQEAVEQLIKLRGNDVIAHALQYRAQLRAGKYEEAVATLRWFAESRESVQPQSAEEVLALAAGLVDHARWSREAKWFDAAVNGLLAAGEKTYPHDWRIPAQRARLFAETHNEPAAVDSLNAAFAKNGSAAELHALRARLAVENFDLTTARRATAQAKRINPELVDLPLLEADMALAELRADLALKHLGADDDQRPLSDEVLGRRLAARESLGMAAANADDDKPSVAALLTQGDAYDRMRRFSQAAAAYRAALERAPQYPGIRAKLGQQLLRLGEEQEGGRLLVEAAQEDPFNVRIKNSLAVLDVLNTYATLETEHFVLRFDRTHDQLLATYAAEYLEREVYPDLIARFGYRPPGKALIEIYNRSRNTSGHGWFSARMVGVPGLHTVGACGGKIVALASPTDMPQPYNWARVLRHEFVHLLNLEQTSFNVPHWVTEGLAVGAEDRPHPDAWLRLITRRYKDGTLYTLDEINFGFIRPSNSDDWTAAYAQAELYLEYLSQQHGPESIAQLLAAFAKNRSTHDAVQDAAGVPVEEFERGYREFLASEVKRWGLLDSTPSGDLERCKQRVAKNPEDPVALAELAAAHFDQRELPLARQYATRAAALAPRQPMAAYVLASLARATDDVPLAERTAQGALDLRAPQEGLLLLLAEIKLADKQYPIAEKLLLLGKKRFPELDQWNVRLARLYGATKADDRLAPILAELVTTQEDSVAAPAKLVSLALERDDDDDAERWAVATLRIDVRHAAAHAALAQVYARREKFDAALAEWEWAVRYNDKHPEWKLQLARALIKQGHRERAAGLLESLLETSPNLPGLVEAAQELRP